MADNDYRRLTSSIYITLTTQQQKIMSLITQQAILYVRTEPQTCRVFPRLLVLVLGGPKLGPYLGLTTIFTFFIQLQ